jgi:hypothetical protein
MSATEIERDFVGVPHDEVQEIGGDRAKEFYQVG